MRVVVVGNGLLAPPEFYVGLIGEDDTVVCADGGANRLVSLGIMPDVLVGDMDSIDPGVLDEVEKTDAIIVAVTPEKNESDTQLALERALSAMPDEIVLTGVLGRRVDHALANIGLLAAVPPSVKCVIQEHDQRLFLIRDSVTLEDPPGTLVSLLAFDGPASGITLEGFKYPLVDGMLRQGITLGISNVIVSKTATVQVTEGVLLAVVMPE